MNVKSTTDNLNREEILRRFEALLDSALTSEPPPQGVDPDILQAVLDGVDSEDTRADSYTLWTAMTSLTQEIKLQGRAFQELNHSLDAQPAKLSAEREKTLQREIERKVRREVLSGLIDLRDRLQRGLESVQTNARKPAQVPGLFARLFAPPPPPDNTAIDAFHRGYELSVERLDQMLSEFNAREIRCQGQPFDPKLMNAIESELAPNVPANTVLEVYRSGYEWNGEVFRTAQVKVSRTPSQETPSGE